MIKCLIVDDEPVARTIIRTYCNHLPELHIVAECGQALEAKTILANQSIDLIFLDIHMPVLTGISFLNTVKQPLQVIFTTAYEEYAITAFELAACDYLLKPFSLERFIVAVDKAKEKLQGRPKSVDELGSQAQPAYFFIKAESKIYRIGYKDCLYLEAQGNYTKVVTVNATFLPKMAFSALIALLPGDLFIRVHRSFLINKSMIHHIDGNRVFIQDKEIPIAETYRDSFLSKLGL
ncbi:MULTISPECIES: LytTR family DNA-binding domain-containing protein [unclassified Spirosoma]|uniref:LytR/AlgR family response regulator transcription factor n=1 Tax=unclassified Spirosoma TaxID=2621999 RepID=UPI000964BE63|nr:MULTISPECIES: LytTR family DNA-binding domain-containing protein [unclassified Spirosoma]MBN8826588.1 response regulator transcription factor [Spirosoma sp.]OJW72839.1 MAG: DNA-binding response regulator [Spirosoma sp. 48-14]